MEIKFDVTDLKLGMYIVELDRPWADTNFAFQGFLLESDQNLAELRRQCSYVIVSAERSAQELFPELANKPPPSVRREVAPPNPKDNFTFVYDSPDQPQISLFSGLSNIVTPSPEQPPSRTKTHNPEQLYKIYDVIEEPKATEQEKQQHISRMQKLRSNFNGHGNNEAIYYENASTLTEEIHTAHKTHEDVCNLASDLMESLSGQDLSERIDLATNLMQDIVDSIIRNPYALDLLSKLKHMDDYLYHHAVDVAVRLIAFGRHLGLPKEQLQLLGMGGLLLDIGRTKLPKEYFKFKGKFKPEELKVIRHHVMYGVEMLNSTGGVPKEVVEMVGLHHERYDGSGYPTHLKGEEIGLFGSMAGIVDTYCAIIAEQPYARSQPSATALKTVIGLKGSGFHPGIVDEFVQTIGVYPIGSLVELNSSEMGIVVRQTRNRRLRPTVLVILAQNRQLYRNPHTVDLMYAPKTGDGEELAIRRELPPGSYGVELADYFL